MRNAGVEAWPYATYLMFPCIRICILQHQISWWYRMFGSFIFPVVLQLATAPCCKTFLHEALCSPSFPGRLSN